MRRWAAALVISLLAGSVLALRGGCAPAPRDVRGQAPDAAEDAAAGPAADGRPVAAAAPRPHRLPAPARSQERRRVEVIVYEQADDVMADRRVPGALVHLTAGGQERVATADAEGRASFDDVPAGDVRTRAEAPGFVASEWGGEPIEVIILERATTLTGIVLDEAGRPVAGAEVVVAAGRTAYGGFDFGTIMYMPLSIEDGELPVRTTTGADGRFAVEGVAPQRLVLVRARTADRGPAQLQVTSGKKGEREGDVTLVLESTGSVAGVVKDADGNPANGAVVCAAEASDAMAVAGISSADIPFHGAGAPGVVATRTDGGAYRIDGLRLGVEYVLVASRDDRAPSVAAHVRVTRDERVAHADLALRGRGKVEVRVLAPDGSVPPESSAWIDTPGGWGGSSLPGTGVHNYWGLLPGRWHVRAEAPGSPPETVEVEIPSAGEAKVTVQLRAGIAWEVDVTDAEGHPVAGATVHAWHDGLGGLADSSAQATTGADGRARLEGLRAGVPHSVDAVAPGFARTVASSEGGLGDGAPRGRIALVRGGLVRGTVRGADGKPAGACVVAKGPIEERAVTTEENGRFELRLPPGRYDVATYDGTRAVAVDVAEGGGVEVELREP